MKNKTVGVSKMFDFDHFLDFSNVSSMTNNRQHDINWCSLINELIGGAYYLKKDFKTSLLHYDLAYKYNPSNVDSFKMIKFLEKELGVSRPALEKKNEGEK